MHREESDRWELLTGEWTNFKNIAAGIVPLPGEIPTVAGIDIYGDTIPLNGHAASGIPAGIAVRTRHVRTHYGQPDLCTSFPPIGTLPSDDVIDRSMMSSVLGFKDRYQLNEWKLMGAGDILLLYTDGLLEHARGKETYFPQHLEAKIREVKHEGARAIFDHIKSHLLNFAEPDDDISVVVIKRQ